MRRSKIDHKLPQFRKLGKLEKKISRALLLALVLWLPSSNFSVARADLAAVPQSVQQNELVVELKPHASIDAVNLRNGTATIGQINATNFYRLSLPGQKTLQKWIKRLGRDPDVLSVSTNPVVASPFSVFGRKVLDFPNDQPEAGHLAQEYIVQPVNELLDLDETQAHSTGRGVVVAVVDTGCDVNHPALASHLWTDPQADPAFPSAVNGWNFVDGNSDVGEAPDPTTLAGHGTFIAGLIALVAPDAKIMPVKAFPPSGVSDAFTVAAAIKFAADHGANVINLSFGSPKVSGVLADAIADAKERGIVMAAAVGNENSKTPQFPASSPDVVGVAAIATDQRKADFSNFGKTVSVDALGVMLISTYPGNEYAMWSGTSFAAPLASAEAAMIIAADPLTPDTGGIIKDTALSIDALNPGFQGRLGKGKINPLGALQGLNAGATVRQPETVNVRLNLGPGNQTPAARGYTELSVSDSAQELQISAHVLSPRTPYSLSIDGVPVIGAQAISNNMGSVKFDLSSNPIGDQIALPASLQPVTSISRIELFDDQNVMALAGSVVPVTLGSQSSQTIQKEARLYLLDGGLSSGGWARAYVDSGHQALAIVCDGFIPSTVYQVFVDGVKVGGNVISEYSYIGVYAASDQNGGWPLPPGLGSVTSARHVVVTDESGQIIVLQGDFKPGGDVLGSAAAARR